MLVGVAVAAATLAAPAAAADVETKIVGGGTVSIEDHPWQVSIEIAIGADLYLCGGSIRDPSHVVTAAHCVVDDGSGYPRVLAPEAFEVGYGSANLDSQSLVGVSAVTVDPRYKRDLSSNAYDEAVLTLSSPIAFGSSGAAPQAVEYASDEELADNFGSGAFATGWGTTAEGGSLPADKNLRGAGLPLRTDQTCLNEYGDSYVPAVMICAGGTGTDTCQGDSGGPLTLDVDPTAGIERKLVGITSGGHGCGRAGIPGYYTWVQSPEVLQVIGNPSPSPAPVRPDANPTVTGVLRVGRVVACDAPPLPGAVPTQYFWYQHTQEFGFDHIGSGRTLTLQRYSRGTRIQCDVRYEGAGGFAYLEPPAGAYQGPVGPAAFLAQTRVGLRLGSQRIPATGPLPVVVSNANNFEVAGRLSGRSTAALPAKPSPRRVSIAAKAFAVGSNRGTTVKLALPRAIQSRLRSNGQVKLDLTAVVRDPAGHARTVTKTVTVKKR
jgi:secreted trypsin-like serine protease